MWKNDEYIYSVGILRAIADSYDSIYQGIETKGGLTLALHPLSIAEFKGDFDKSLNAIGRGDWTGYIDYKEFKDFRRFGRLQQIVIADIYGVEDRELEALGFYDIPRLRGYAYSAMKRFLTTGETGFVSRST